MRSGRTSCRAAISLHSVHFAIVAFPLQQPPCQTPYDVSPNMYMQTLPIILIARDSRAKAMTDRSGASALDTAEICTEVEAHIPVACRQRALAFLCTLAARVLQAILGPYSANWKEAVVVAIVCDTDRSMLMVVGSPTDKQAAVDSAAIVGVNLDERSGQVEGSRRALASAWDVARAERLRARRRSHHHP